MEHTVRKYEEELGELRRKLLLMAGRVEEMIAHSIEALVNQDLELARATILQDNIVNRDEIDTDEYCLSMLARWQPMASDLRFITRALKMVTDIERIGDLAVNVCERAIELGTAPPMKAYVDIPRMARIVQSMIHDTVDAFVAADDQKALAVIDRDDEVDELYHKVILDLLGLMTASEANVEPGWKIQSVAKVLERMGDHCTNVAEEVIYMFRGKDVRHKGKLSER